MVIKPLEKEIMIAKSTHEQLVAMWQGLKARYLKGK